MNESRCKPQMEQLPNEEVQLDDCRRRQRCIQNKGEHRLHEYHEFFFFSSSC